MMSLEGMENIQKLIRHQPDAARAYLSDAVAKSTTAVSQRMQAGVPVREGLLKSSIRAELPRRNGLSGRVVIDPRAYYWRFLEYGTVKMAARPFVRPAADAEAETFFGHARQALRNMERDWSASRFV
jgi:HK97 gp10 family phage protein